MDRTQDKFVTDFEKLKFLKDYLPEEHLEAYRKDFGFNQDNSFWFHTFSPFCRAYAKYLLQSGALTYYGDFIGSFNELIKKDEDYNYYKMAQKGLIQTGGLFSYLNFNYEKSFIEDERYEISNQKFRYESDLEHLMISEIESFYGDEVIVKSQQKHGYGISDITLNDSITLELKKGKAKRKDVYQAFEYSFDSDIKEVCLVASEFDESTLEIANKLGVSCFAYCFMFEDYSVSDQYPIGFVLEKVNKVDSEELSQILSEMDAFWISYYKPNFSFKKVFDKEYKTNMNIHDRTKEIINHNKQHILPQLKELGYDTSDGIEGVLEQINKEEVLS